MTTSEQQPGGPRGLPREVGEFAGAVREVTPDLLQFPYFGTLNAFLTEDGIVLVDTGTAQAGARALEELRKRSDLPIHTIIYTHGHLDHVGGAPHFLREAAERGRPRPRIVAHQRLVARLRRYERMWPWIQFIGGWQWDRAAQPNVAGEMARAALPAFAYPDVLYDDHLTLQVGGVRFDLRHGLGETDDTTWVWQPERRALCSGDFIIGSTPNVGNPWKVQRYTIEWAEALEEMAALRPDALLPGHGPVVRGEQEIAERLLSTARYLCSIHDQVVERMNHGQWLEQIWHEVRPPEDLAALPWLQGVYGHPQFVIQGVWRQYGGWWDGDPATMFPARTADQAREVVGVAGATALLDRARAVQQAGDLALACQLVDLVRVAEPENLAGWRLWRDLFAVRAEGERNMMARNTYRQAVRDAEAALARLGDTGA